MKPVRYLVIFSLFIILAGCTFSRQQPQQPVEVDFQTAIPYVPTVIPIEPTIIPIETENSISTSEPEKPTSYTLQVDFDLETHVLHVIEEIYYQNQSGVPLQDISLMVPMNHTPGVFVLNSLQNAETFSQFQYQLNGVTLDVILDAPLAESEHLAMLIEYEITLPNERGVLGYTDRQVNVCDWYVFVPPYQMDSGWMTNEYHSVGEYLVYDVADFDVTINVINDAAGVLIIGSVPGSQDGNRWLFSQEQARTFVWTASDAYEKLIQAEYPQVVAYVFPEDVNAGWSALATTISAWNLYSAVYGEPPQDQITLVEADFYDGMEYEGLFFLGFDYFESYNGGEKNYLTAIAAHETAHQWWFAGVGNDAANEPWLDESLAIYSELIFYETYYPGDENWWWNFRVNSFQPEGSVNDSIYSYSTWRPYINAIYLRGAQMIQEIRMLMGDEAFFRFLQAYYQAGSGKIMTRQDFFDLAMQFSDVDFQPIIDVFFSEG
jgi:hypothetical protein